jgi:hypothetical protein
MRKLHIKYSSVHKICKLVRVFDMQQFHRAWPGVLRFCRRTVFVSSKPNRYSGAPRVLLIQFCPLTACILSFPLCCYKLFSSTHMGFVVDKVALCPHLFRFSLPVPFHHCPVHLRHNMAASLSSSFKNCYSLFPFRINPFLCNWPFNIPSFCFPFHSTFLPCFPLSLSFVFYFLRTFIFILSSCTSCLPVLCLLLSSNCDAYGWLQRCFMRAAKVIQQSVLLD